MFVCWRSPCSLFHSVLCCAALHCLSLCDLTDSLSLSLSPCLSLSGRYCCMGPGAMWIRFGAPCEGVTATPCGLQRPVYVQSTWLRSRDPPDYPLRHQFVADLVEELTLCK